MNRLHLVLGGARSGKSRYAETLARDAEARGQQVVVVATALAGDAEMARRIAKHRAQRPAHWRVCEVGPGRANALALQLREAAQPGCFVVVDCLTLWLSQLMCPPPGVPVSDAGSESAALLQALEAVQAQVPVVLVSNEIGQGVVPLDAGTRAVVDALGRLHQDIAAMASRVTLMVAGLPLAVKGSPQ
ncbi:bifunctional adenosylcobinamide kinase/adenosylcobinamide-phosphate guanylyltransferase [Methylibium rhizosphaerae]|uniref:bifunctional adenosylcobinamide kinase/adenosylcobinamide-phosphate guanylyltransferase n=1 Tax=Methylibium rhizosphaerae TaxID=2570323 RepID=UPI0015E32FC5|nr:bifunctional adenosylcobinamide kinase/adenosylcobinamide-phosphate guanylyltransferase [Methylibium rhizosphaerae]